jgi:hypothetical protein
MVCTGTFDSSKNVKSSPLSAPSCCAVRRVWAAICLHSSTGDAAVRNRPQNQPEYVPITIDQLSAITADSVDAARDVLVVTA